MTGSDRRTRQRAPQGDGRSRLPGLTALACVLILPPLATPRWPHSAAAPQHAMAPQHAIADTLRPELHAAVAPWRSVAAPSTPPHALPWRLDFRRARPSPAVRRFARSVLAQRDQGGRAFVILDKTAARVFVLGIDDRMVGDLPVLLGLARGDDSVPGIGERPVPDIRPFERTTPAGRFVASAGVNAHGEDIVWVDFNVAVSMHRVRATDPRERRLQRLATRTPADNRISCGCINVPPAFFNRVLAPIFRQAPAVV